MDLEYVEITEKFMNETVKPIIDRGEYKSAGRKMIEIRNQATINNPKFILVPHAMNYIASIELLFNELMRDSPDKDDIEIYFRGFNIDSRQYKMRLEALTQKS